MDDIHDIYEDLLELIADGDERSITDRVKTLLESGLVVKVESEDEKE